MVRPLAIRKPNGAELRRVQAILEQTADRQIQRRAEAILFYSTGLNAVEIAEALRVHPNTIYADLHAFNEQGIASLRPLSRGGAPARITNEQRAEIERLAEQAPSEFRLPYGRWSLTKFQDFLIHQKRVIQSISLEHLRRLLKKRRFASNAFSAN